MAMRFTAFVLKNALRRRWRSLLTVCGVSIAIATAVTLLGLAKGFESAFLETYSRRGIDLVVVRAGAAQRLSSALPERLGGQIERLPGVERVVPGLIDVVSYEDHDLYGVLLHGWKVDRLMYRDFRLVAGRFLRESDHRAVMVGKVLARHLALHVGDTFEIVEGEPFEVVGVYDSFSVYENGGMVVPLRALQELMAWENQVTGFAVILRDGVTPGEVERLRGEIESLAPALSAMPAKDHVETTAQIRLIRAMARVTTAVAILIGIVGLLNTMLMAVFERTREIGILRAIGWRRPRILRLFLMESVALSLIGAVLGIVAATFNAQLLSRFPSTAGFVSGEIAPLVMVEGCLLAVAVGVGGGLYPAWRAARMAPLSALRYD